MGQVVKLCNNLIYAAQMLATAEATVMAEKAGVDLGQLYEILTHATGDCVAVRTRLPARRRRARQPGVQRLGTGLHDRPDGQGPRPRDRLRGEPARRCFTSGLVRQVLGAASRGRVRPRARRTRSWVLPRVRVPAVVKSAE